MSEAHQVLGMLKRHYLPENRPAPVLFLPEIGSPDGKRRADLIVIPLSLAGRSEGAVIGHEIKVSRADIRAELDDPTKADPWAQYCSRWWLTVSDPDLLEGLWDDLPDFWGVMGPPSGRRTRSMTILRPAPLRKVTADMAPVVTRIAAFVQSRYVNAMQERQRQMDWYYEANQKLQTQVHELRLSGGVSGRQAERVAHIIAGVQARSRVEHLWGEDTTDEEIIDTLTDLAATKQAVRDLHRQIEYATSGIKSLLDECPRALEQLKRPRKVS